MHPTRSLAMTAALLAAAIHGATVAPAFAAWPNATTVNLPVCTATRSQYNLHGVPDGAGGALFVWDDARVSTGNYDVYVQHVLASGIVDPAWPVDGVPVCMALGYQGLAAIIPDGAGGALVSWADIRDAGTGNDIYAHHVLASGIVDPAWPVDGLAASIAPGPQASTQIVSDGGTGAIITWQDTRGSSLDIYAQHVLITGGVDPAWTLNGVAVCTAANNQSAPAIAADGAHGAIITWTDLRNGLNYDIYAQHLRSTGSVDPAWPANGRALCTAAGNQERQSIVSDAAGGAIVAWHDLRGGATADIYAQRVRSTGAVDPAWPADGRALCTAASNQYYPMLVSDGAGGAIATWEDFRNGLGERIACQHVQSGGAVDPSWPVDGRFVTATILRQVGPGAVSDGAGGVFVAWSDQRTPTGGGDMYVQHILAGGALDPAWPAEALPLCTLPNSQMYSTLVDDGTGGVIVGWSDNRGGADTDMYAQRVARYGYRGSPEPQMIGAADTPADQGGHVTVTFAPSDLDTALDTNLAAYDIARALPPSYSTWTVVATVTPNHSGAPYAVAVPTTTDSTGAGNPLAKFRVTARHSSGTIAWPSLEAAGYSVDNLAPALPAAFSATTGAGVTRLHWQRNTEGDLAGYRLYRDVSPSFTPSPASLLASPPDTGYADVTVTAYTYKLCAVDVHGNASGFAVALPPGMADVGDGVPLALALAPASPNPATRATTLRFSLPAAGEASLVIFDAAGRRVRTLAGGMSPAGEHAATWDLRDARGHEVQAGLYFARLEASGRAIVRRMAVTR